MEIQISKVWLSTKGKSKPSQMTLNAYHHTLFSQIPEYKTNTYRRYQTKIDGDEVLALIIDDDGHEMTSFVDGLAFRKFRNKRQLFASNQITVTENIYVSAHPILYQLSNYLPITSHDQLAYFQEEIIHRPEELRSASNGNYLWSSQKLIDFLYSTIMPDLDFMLSSICMAGIEEFYVIVFPEIKSFRLRNIHNRKEITYQTAFDLYFASNINLPDHLAIGHQITIGHGVITRR